MRFGVKKGFAFLRQSSALSVAWAIFCATSSFAEGDPEAIERGAALLAPFKRDLQQALRAGLEKGPVEAIVACQVRAPQIAEALSRDGVRLGRASHRLRNPANRGPEWVRPLLDAYVAEPGERGARVVAIASDRLGYVEPIVVQPLCLACHGREIVPELAAEIERRYPEDEATGFQPGDLRGVFWVEYPARKEAVE